MNTRFAALSSADKRALARDLLGGTRAPSAAVPAGEIPAEWYRPELFPGYRNLERQAATMERVGIRNPYFGTRSDVGGARITIAGKRYVNFSGYNYLGLSGHPAVNAAAQEAITRYGTSASASRIVSGEIDLHRELEATIVAVTGTEAATVQVSGYGTNVSTIGYLFGAKDLILHDELAHNSLITGCKLSGAKRIPFPHNDPAALDRLLDEHRRYHERVLVVIEGAYSMDGDIPDLAAFVSVKQRHHALLMVDEAHSIGVLGARGGGIAEAQGVAPAAVEIWMGTLSKAWASCGGYIAGSRALVDNLRYFAPGGILYSVGISPANAAAALAAIRTMQAEPERLRCLHQRSDQFLQSARAAGLDTGPSCGTPVVPVIVGNSVRCLRLGQRLFDEGINVQAVLHPAVPEQASRLRFFITAEHQPEEIDRTVVAVARHLRALSEGATA